MLSLYIIQSNKRTKKASITIYNNISHLEHDLKRPQLISNGLVKSDTNTKSNKKNKNILETGSTHVNFEINDQYLDEMLDNMIYKWN